MTLRNSAARDPLLMAESSRTVGADGGATESLRSTVSSERARRLRMLLGLSRCNASAATRWAVPQEQCQAQTTWGYGFAYLPPSDASEATPTPRATPISLETILNRIAFASDRDSTGGADGIYVMNADGSDVTEYPSGEPIWSPDGSRIAFAITMTETSPYIRYERGWLRQDQLDESSCGRRSPSWSPDGRRIVFALRDGPGTDLFGRNAEIYVMNADGSAQTRLTNDPATDKDPSWSPDGQRIASRGATTASAVRDEC